MNWQDVLIAAMKDPAEVRKMSELARQHREIQAPAFDNKQIQAEGRPKLRSSAVYEGEYTREPGEDE